MRISAASEASVEQPKSAVAIGGTTLLLGGIVLLGVVLRVRALAWNRSLWMDEALLANNVLQRGFLGLLRPLDDAQTAPLGFLWSGEGASRIFGFAEWSLRLPALAAGVAGLAGVALLAREAFEATAARVVAIGAAALSATAIYFSAEFKPYSCDMAAGAVLAWLALRALRLSDVRSMVWLGIAAAVCVLFSSAAIFAIAGVFAVLAANLVARRQWRPLAWLCASGALVACVFATHYLLVLQHAAGSAALYAYWANAFPPQPFAPAGVRWLVTEAPSLVVETLGLARPRLMLPALLAGAAWMASRRPWALAALLAPAAVVYVAGVASQYPLYARLLMLLAPAGFALVGGAVAWVGELPLRRPMAVHAFAGLLGTALLLDTALLALVDALAPPGREELRDVLAAVSASAAGGDRFYVHAEAGYAFDFYAATRPDLNPARLGPVHISRDRELTPAEIVADVLRHAEGRRAWIIYSHMVYNPGQVETEVDELISRQAQPFDAFEAEGASAYGYDPH